MTLEEWLNYDNVKKKGMSFEDIVFNDLVEYTNASKLNDKKAKFNLNGSDYYIIKNSYISFHENDLFIADRPMYELIEQKRKTGSRTKGYLLTVECKFYGDEQNVRNIKRRVAVDLFAKNKQLRPNLSIALKKNTNNRFNWIETFLAAGVLPITYTDKFSKIAVKSLNKNNHTLNEINKWDKEKKNESKTKLIREICNKHEQIKKWGKYFGQKKKLEAILKTDFENDIYAGRINDITIADNVGFSCTGAVLKIDNGDIILVNYTKNNITKPKINKMIGNIEFTADRGVFYYSGEITKNASDLLEEYGKIKAKKI
jgi:hypothetical protein